MKSITLLLSLLLCGTWQISKADYEIQMVNERYPSNTRLLVDVQMRDPDANFDLGGTQATGFNITELIFDYGTVGTGAGQITFNNGASTSSLHSDYSVSFGLTGDDARVQIFNFSGGNLVTINGTYQTLFTLEFTVGSGSFTSHQFSITPQTTSTVYNDGGSVIDDEPTALSGYSNESLPVELVTLQGRKYNKSIKIDWETAMEEQNEGFYVERSYNGLEFEQIDFIPGNGFSSEAILYEYLDHHFDQSAEVVFYRLKQVDFDGKFEYSHVISVRNKNIDDGSLEISVFPNPANTEVIITATDQVNLRVLGTSGTVLYESYNSNGALVDLSAFAKGFYIVEAFSDDNSVIKREKLIVE